MAKREIKHSIEDIDEQINQESIPYDYDTKEYPVEVIIHKFDQGQIFVPTYQRQFVWKLNQRARFIESVFSRCTHNAFSCFCLRKRCGT